MAEEATDKNPWGDLFTAFNFSVEITIPGENGSLCGGAFAECDGLEVNQEVKTIREGGNNGRQLRLAGPATYGTLTLKRGMTSSLQLWTWFEKALIDPALRADAQIVMQAVDHKVDHAQFTLTGCRPLKLKAPPLNAKEGLVAVEELQVAYESLRIQPPSGGGRA